MNTSQFQQICDDSKNSVLMEGKTPSVWLFGPDARTALRQLAWAKICQNSEVVLKQEYEGIPFTFMPIEGVALWWGD